MQPPEIHKEHLRQLEEKPKLWNLWSTITNWSTW